MNKNKNRTGILWAVALILTGLVILLASFDVITVEKNIYFFIAIAIIGVVFHVACFIGKPKKYSYLVPGGMFLMYAALFITCEYSDAFSLDELWPIIILSLAFGMLEQKVFSRGKQGSWATLIIVSIVGFFFLIRINLSFGIAFGILLILVGVIIVVRMAKKIPKETAQAEPKKEETAPEVDDFDKV